MSYNYVAGRLLALLPVMFVVTVTVFTLTHLLPGDPVLALLTQESNARFDVESYERARHDLGLDKPLPVQYLKWLKGVVTGDLGRDAVTQQPITQAIKQRAPVTLQLFIAAHLLSLAIAIPAGAISAYKHNTLFDRSITTIALVGVAMPSFWLAILLILLFGVELHWLPPSGWVSITDDPVQALRHMAMPVFVLGFTGSAGMLRQVRSSLLEALGQDYVRTARSKGLNERRVVLTHALRNGLLPVLTIMGLAMGRLLGGSVIVETLFAIPGLGRLSVNAVIIHDYPVVQATVLIAAFCILLANLATDLLYGVVDPRVKLR